jgi:hypothetical protein
VQYFAITVQDGTFKPVFNSPGYPANRPSFQIKLGASTFNDIPGLPNYLFGWVGAHHFSYYETRYFGNPGHYEEFGFGLNEAGYLPNNTEVYLSVLLQNPQHRLEISENIEQDLAPVQDLRTKVIFNTYAVSAPFVAIKDYAASNLGVSYYQVRTLKQNS